MSSARSRLNPVLWAGAALAVVCLAVPVVSISTAPAAAQQVNVSVQFRTALDPYGKWHRHKRWGEVWVPARVGDDWRPYTRGRWVYSEDYGWYWVSADEEAEWGWVVFHYGRWVDDGEYGWVWVPGNDWGPAWVDWRRGDSYVGWAPLPPDEVVVAYREEPTYWTFVRPRDLLAPRIHVVILPPRQRDVYIRQTVIVNTTLVVRDRRFAVNPGIPPAYIAAAYGRPIKTFRVRPRVLAGTARIDGAIVVSNDDLRRGRDRRGRRGDRDMSVVQETNAEIRPARAVPKAQALGTNEQGRLGDNPPKAARGASVVAPAAAARPGGGDAAKDAARDADKSATTRGRGPAGDSDRKGAARDGATPPTAAEHGEGDRDRRRGAASRDERRGTDDAREGPRRRDAAGSDGNRSRGERGRSQPQKSGSRDAGERNAERGADDNKASERAIDRTRRTTGQGGADEPRREGRPTGRDRPGRDAAADVKPKAAPREARGDDPGARRPAQPPAAARRSLAPDRPAAAARPSAPPAAARRPERLAPAARAPQSAPPAPAARAPRPAPAPAARAPRPAPAPAARAPRPQPSTTGSGGPVGRPPGVAR